MKCWRTSTMNLLTEHFFLNHLQLISKILAVKTYKNIRKQCTCFKYVKSNCRKLLKHLQQWKKDKTQIFNTISWDSFNNTSEKFFEIWYKLNLKIKNDKYEIVKRNLDIVSKLVTASKYREHSEKNLS